MTTNRFNQPGVPVIDLDGNLARGALVYFYETGTTSPRAVYTDQALSMPHAHPIVCGATGHMPDIYLQYGGYRVRITTADGVLIDDMDGVTNPAPASSGGGGGVIVTASEIAQTGDIKPRFDTAPQEGWVILNGETIGSPLSNANGLANVNTQNLFIYMWNRAPQPASASDKGGSFVIGGRGSSAAADWAANKQITLIDMRGLVVVGADSMGASAANVIQVTTATITTTNGFVAATVSSAASLAIGMFVNSANVPSGTTIADIVGTTITLSAPATATASNTAARFSFFRDAQAVGNVAGTNSHQLRQRELAAHNHGGQTTGASTGLTNSVAAYSLVTFGQGIPQFNLNVATANGSENTGGSTRTHSIASQGNDLPHNNLQPSITVTYYMKL